jgi:hypothetical protein
MPTRDPITPDEAFDGLPPEVRAAIDSVGWQEKLRAAAGSRKLRVDQGAALEDETLRFMAGLQTVEEYAVHLAQELSLPEAEFKALAAEIDREIFQPIQQKLRATMPGDDGETASAAASVGQGEEDDLEALLNQDDEVLARAAAATPKPLASMAAPAASAPKPLPAAPAPVVPEVAPVLAATPPAPIVPATAVSTPVSSLSGAAQKLAAPVVKPAEVITANLQRAPEAPTAPAAPADPYREQF